MAAAQPEASLLGHARTEMGGRMTIETEMMNEECGRLRRHIKTLEAELKKLDAAQAQAAVEPAKGAQIVRPLVEANCDEVICPNCCNQFRAIPVNVQQLMLDAGFEPPFKTYPAVEPVNEWKEAVLDQLAAHGMDAPMSDSPAIILAKIIQMAVLQATDPAISKEAAVEPVAYLAWRDGNPCYEGDDAVCEDAVWPVDFDDDRTSMPVYTSPPDHTAEIDSMKAAMRPALKELKFYGICYGGSGSSLAAIAALEKELSK
jgi:hypothetical protein